MVLVRKAKGFNQTQLAKRLSSMHDLPFHQQTIQRIETGARPVRLNEAVLIAQELGTSLSTMMASAPLGAREAMRAVDDLREVARNLDLEPDFEALERANLPLVLFDLLGEDEPPDVLDQTALYALKWAVELANVAAALADAERLASEIADGKPGHTSELPQYKWIHALGKLYAEQLDELPRFPEAPRDPAS